MQQQNRFRELYDIRPRNRGEIVMRTLVHTFSSLVLVPIGAVGVVTGGAVAYGATVVAQNFLGNANEAMRPVPAAVNEGRQTATQTNKILEFFLKNSYFLGGVVSFVVAVHLSSACNNHGEVTSDCTLSHELSGKLSLYGGVTAMAAGAASMAVGAYKVCTARA